MMLQNVLRIMAILLLCMLVPTQARAIDTFPPVDIIIDPGHGGIDSGTKFGDLYEKDINLQIAKILYKELSDYGYHVVLNRTGDYALSEDNIWSEDRSRHKRDLAQREHFAIELRPKIMVSLHVNWSRNPKTHGPLVLYQKNTRSYLLADHIQHSLNQLYKTTWLPQPGKTYYLLNHSPCPTVIVEMGFISNNIDRERLTTSSSQIQIAKAIGKSINEYFSIHSHYPDQ